MPSDGRKARHRQPVLDVIRGEAFGAGDFEDKRVPI